jgi:hypothetical protein
LTQNPGGLSRKLIVVVIAVVVVVGSLTVVLVYANQSGSAVSTLPAGSSSVPSSSASTAFQSIDSSSSGLALEVDLNATVMSSRGAIAAQLTLFNSLGENLTFALSYPANSTISDWNGYDTDTNCGVHGFFGSMVGYALFQGSYSLANISLAGSPLQLGPQVVTLGCISGPNPDSVVFLPHSDTAVLSGNPEQIALLASTGSCLSISNGYSCVGNDALSGYWNTTAPLSPQDAEIGSPYFRYFSPGEYTLVVEDMWNQTVYAHFQVTPNSTTGTINENVRVNGTCTAVSYIIPDTEEVSLTTVTVTSGTNTTYSVSTVTISHAAETTLGTTTYSTFTNVAMSNVGYVVTTTSQDLNDIPSDGWTVAVCTYQP